MASATSDDIQKVAEEEGMITMLEDGFIKAVQGITSIEEILRASGIRALFASGASDNKTLW